MLISTKTVFSFQGAYTSPFATLSPAGWLVSSPANQVVCCSHFQTAKIRDLKGASDACTVRLIAFCHLVWSFLLSWGKALLWPAQLARTLQTLFSAMQKSSVRSSELRWDAESLICSTGPRRDLWLYVHTYQLSHAYSWCPPLHCNTIHSRKERRSFWVYSFQVPKIMVLRSCASSGELNRASYHPLSLAI